MRVIGVEALRIVAAFAAGTAHVHRARLLELHPVVHAFPPGPLIDAGDTHHGAIGLNSAAILYTPQDRGVAHWHTEPAPQPLEWSTTRAVAEQSDDPGHARGPACDRGPAHDAARRRSGNRTDPSGTASDVVTLTSRGRRGG
jgi:hypothetical protein